MATAVPELGELDLEHYREEERVNGGRWYGLASGGASSGGGTARASPAGPIYMPAMAASVGEISPDRWRYFGYVLSLNGHGGSPYLCACQSSALSMVAMVDGGGATTWPWWLERSRGEKRGREGKRERAAGSGSF